MIERTDLVRWCGCVLGLMLAANFADAAAPYKTIKPMTREDEGAIRTSVGNMLKGREALDETTLQNWYLRAKLAKLTQPVRDGRNLWLIRSEILRDLTDRNCPPDVHAFVSAKVYQICNGMISPKHNFSPIARYNAMLILGGLNEEEAVTTGSNRSLPKPMVHALGVMLNELKRTDQVDAVRVAALIGILRHAELSRAGVTMPSKAQAIVTQQAVSLLKSSPPGNRSEEGHEWMQRRAMEILGALGSAGNNGEIAQLLDGVIRDENASIAKRCSALDAIAQLEISSDPGLDLKKTTLGLGTITAMACRRASNRLVERFRERGLNGGGFSPTGAGYGGYGAASSGYEGYGGSGGASSSDGYGGYSRGRGGSSPDGGYGGYGRGYGSGYDADGQAQEEELKEDPLLTEARRDLKHRLGCVRRGIRKAQQLAANDPTLGDLEQLVSDLLKSLDAEDLNVDSFKLNVDQKADTIEKAFGIETEEPEGPAVPDSVRPPAKTVPA